MPYQKKVFNIVLNILKLNAQASEYLSVETPLLGAIPEFDSMAVVNIIAALEEQFGFTVADDEIDASVFETMGTLLEFVNDRL